MGFRFYFPAWAGENTAGRSPYIWRNGSLFKPIHPQFSKKRI